MFEAVKCNDFSSAQQLLEVPGVDPNYQVNERSLLMHVLQFDPILFSLFVVS